MLINSNICEQLNLFGRRIQLPGRPASSYEPIQGGAWGRSSTGVYACNPIQTHVLLNRFESVRNQQTSRHTQAVDTDCSCARRNASRSDRLGRSRSNPRRAPARLLSQHRAPIHLSRRRESNKDGNLNNELLLLLGQTVS